MKRFLLLWAAFCSLWLGCSEAAPIAEILVYVDSDLKVGTQLTSLRVRVLDAAGEAELERRDLPLSADGPAAQKLPLSFSLVPVGRASEFRLVVTGRGPLGNGGEVIDVVERQRDVAFLPHERLLVTIDLRSRCLFNFCEGTRATQTCDDGTCISIPSQPLPPANEGPLGGFTGFTRDTDPASMPDAGRADAGARADATVATECSSGATRSCGVSLGACKPGLQRCVDGVWSSECAGAVMPAAVDGCTPGDDANCNGAPNEGCGGCSMAAANACAPGRCEAGSCICPPPLVAQGDQCVDLCANKSCGPGGTCEAGICQCAAGFTLVDGVCACPSGQTYRDGACQCPSGQSLTNGTCQCPVGQVPLGDSCACPGGQVWIGIGCTCPRGRVLIGGVCRCVGVNLDEPDCRCTGGQVFQNGACVCPAGQQMVDGQCTCMGGQISVAGLCLCPPGLALIDGVCRCPIGQSPQNGVCTFMCEPGQVATPQGCACPEGQVEEDGQCKQPCPDGRSRNPRTCGVCNACRSYASEDKGQVTYPGCPYQYAYSMSCSGGCDGTQCVQMPGGG